jgi:hypothetical protein
VVEHIVTTHLTWAEKLLLCKGQKSSTRKCKKTLKLLSSITEHKIEMNDECTANFKKICSLKDQDTLHDRQWTHNLQIDDQDPAGDI